MSGTQFHINKAGDPDVCHAEKRACPLGGEHFDSIEDAMFASFKATQPMTLRDAQDLAVQLMRENGLQGWGFGFNKRFNSAGVCRFDRRTGSGRIELSEAWTRNHPRAKVEDTIKHEIAHALAGHEAGHGPRWQSQARSLGAEPQACFEADEEQRDSVYPWKGTCPNCGASTHKGSAPRRVLACGSCSNGEGWHPSRIYEWSKSGQPVDPYDMPNQFRREYQGIEARHADYFKAKQEAALGEPVNEPVFATAEDDGGCHYYGGWNHSATEPEEPAKPKKSEAQKAAELAEFIETLKKMYMEKFGTHPDDDGVDAAMLLKMFNDGELA